MRVQEQYEINGKIAVDKIFRYEHIEDEMAAIATLLKLPEKPALPHAKGNFRTDKRHYRDILSDADRDVIAKFNAREIALFGYEW